MCKMLTILWLNLHIEPLRRKPGRETLNALASSASTCFEPLIHVDPIVLLNGAPRASQLLLLLLLLLLSDFGEKVTIEVSIGFLSV